MLGAHRTFKMDIRGDSETYANVTTFKAHEGFWKMERVGSLDTQKYVLRIINNRCVKDRVHHFGWSLELPKIGLSARGENCPDWFAEEKRPYRDMNSVYCLIANVKSRRPWNVEFC